MKLIHLSDLHLGKRVNEFSMIEDQKYILTKIIHVIDEEKLDGVIIAGDVYDKSIPSAEAVELFDDFIVRLAKRELEVYIISGNHDSPERLAFGNRLMDLSGVHFSPVYDGNITPLMMEDDFGKIGIYMLPFIKPVHVRQFFPDESITTYNDALKLAISKMDLSQENRNILITHQFVTGASRSESEEITVGGSDNIDASIFEAFDYVAMGHIHGPQNIGSERIRYCGTPLKYSFSESSHEKSVTVVEFFEKGNLSVRTVPLKPLRELVELKGKYADLTNKSFYEGTSYREDYVHITLTDEEDIPDAIAKLRVIYHHLMKLDYDNQRTRTQANINVISDIERKTPFDLFSEFYLQQNGMEMSEDQAEFMKKMIERTWEGEQ